MGQANLRRISLKEIYNLEDALVVAGFLNSFIRHADVVKIANIAQIVNVIAPLLTKGDDLLLQSIFYPFEMVAKRRKGVSLCMQQEGDGYDSGKYGWASFIDVSAILDKDQMHCFLVNRHLGASQQIQVEVADTAVTAFLNGEVLTGPDAKAANTWAERDVVGKRPFEGVQIENGRVTVELPPLSMAAISLSLDK